MMTFNIKAATWLIRAVFSDIVVPKILATLLCKQTRKRTQQEMWQSAIRIPTIKTLLLRKYLELELVLKEASSCVEALNPICVICNFQQRAIKHPCGIKGAPDKQEYQWSLDDLGKKTLAVHLKMSYGRTSFLKGGSFLGKPGANLSDIKKIITTLLLDHTEGLMYGCLMLKIYAHALWESFFLSGEMFWIT